jgi:uncharacterized protein (UPF0332 family)
MKEYTESRLDKASHSIRAAWALLAMDEADIAASRAYYAMFYAAEALLFEEGLAFRKHSAVHAAFGRQFAASSRLDPRLHRWLLDAFDTRNRSDYGVDAGIRAQEVKDLIERAETFLAECQRYLGSA